MKKLFILFISTLLICSCSSNDDKGIETVTVSIPGNAYYGSLKEGSDGYMYIQATTFNYAASDVISYEIIDVVGEPTILSHSRGQMYHGPKEAHLFTMRYVFDLTADQWKELKKEVNVNDIFLTSTLKLTLKAGYKTYD